MLIISALLLSIGLIVAAILVAQDKFPGRSFSKGERIGGSIGLFIVVFLTLGMVGALEAPEEQVAGRSTQSESGLTEANKIIADFPELSEHSWPFQVDDVVLSCFSDYGPNAIIKPYGGDTVYALNGTAQRWNKSADEIAVPSGYYSYLIGLSNSLCPNDERGKRWVRLKHDPEKKTIAIEVTDKGFLSEREQNIQSAMSMFSVWDGSNKPLVKLIKSSMHDPDSFDHVDTTFNMGKDLVVVTMKYRGTNMFGAVVTETVYAKISFAGKIMEISQ